jgi:hypothetical protein
MRGPRMSEAKSETPEPYHPGFDNVSADHDEALTKTQKALFDQDLKRQLSLIRSDVEGYTRTYMRLLDQDSYTPDVRVGLLEWFIDLHIHLRDLERYRLAGYYTEAYRSLDSWRKKRQEDKAGTVDVFTTLFGASPTKEQ